MKIWKLLRILKVIFQKIKVKTVKKSDDEFHNQTLHAFMD